MTSLDIIPLFEGSQIRTMERKEEVWFRIDDLALAWGIDRTTPGKLIDRHPEVFEGFTLSVAVGDITSPDEWRCVNERGLYLLMGKISADRLKNKEARAAMIRFQRWVPELIQKYRKKEIVQVPAENPDRMIKSELGTAKMLAEATGRDVTAFQAIALERCGLKDYVPALQPPVQYGETGWLTPTAIAERCGCDLSARNINHYLYNKGYQVPEGGLWRLTEKGRPFGEEYVFEATSKHREIRIRWRESILAVSGLIPEQPGQTALLARA